MGSLDLVIRLAVNGLLGLRWYAMSYTGSVVRLEHAVIGT